MLPSDIETEHAYSLLSRRHFLQVMGATGAGLALSLNGGNLAAHAAAPLAPADGILIVVSLLGGNDGMNTVVPINNDRYFAKRKGLAIPASQTLGIGGGFGLHPKLTYLKSLYDQGHVAARCTAWDTQARASATSRRCRLGWEHRPQAGRFPGGSDDGWMARRTRLRCGWSTWVSTCRCTSLVEREQARACHRGASDLAPAPPRKTSASTLGYDSFPRRQRGLDHGVMHW